LEKQLRKRTLTISIAGQTQELHCRSAKYSSKKYEPSKDRKYNTTISIEATRKGILVTTEEFDVMFYCDHNFEEGVIHGCESLLDTLECG
jgi:hypothetical protein